jgi:hypothetical protein
VVECGGGAGGVIRQQGQRGCNSGRWTGSERAELEEEEGKVAAGAVREEGRGHAARGWTVPQAHYQVHLQSHNLRRQNSNCPTYHHHSHNYETVEC